MGSSSTNEPLRPAESPRKVRKPNGVSPDRNGALRASGDHVEPSDFFHLHAHSEFSHMDGMGQVESMVAKVARLGQPALALTDHGHLAGAIRLYKECQKAGIAAFPGSEMYLVTDATDAVAKTQRYHLGLIALNRTGWKTLVALSSRSHLRERFHKKPLIDFADLSAMSESGLTQDLVLTTGCWFGLLQQTLATKGDDAARGVLKMLASWFPHTVVEVQNHRVVHDDGSVAGVFSDAELVDALVALAQEVSLPVAATQDSHYLDSRDQNCHDLMKDICYFGDSDDNRFPGGPYHLCSTHWLRKRFDPRHWALFEDTYEHLLDLHRLSLPALDTYKFHVPRVSKTPDDALLDQCLAGTVRRGHHEFTDVNKKRQYSERMFYELGVIKKMGMANYFLLVREVVEWARGENIVITARGSANGSLVCYYLGISGVDPIQWRTNFDRFLSVDRQKPPDIDLDIESKGRDRVIEYVRKRFPTMTQIGNWLKIGQTESQDEEGFGQDHGSVYVQYAAAMRRKLGAYSGIAPEHRPLLEKLDALNVRKNPGRHAGGFVLPGETLALDEYLATMLIPSSNTVCTQSVMEDVEAAGYVKLDMLGVKTLATMAQCLENIGRARDDWEWIPWNDAAACKLLRSGHGTGIFQFSGATTARGGREMGIRSTQDAIFCMALYRPALMNGGQTEQYLQNRKTPRQAKKLHSLFDPILKDTCYVPVFQEQIMEMCRAIGMAYADWNDLMKAVKASNDKIVQYAEAIFDRVKPIWWKLCAAKGFDRQATSLAWHAVVGFTDYGFNRAHATAYGIMAYRQAYLKAYYPVEYMHALLTTWAGDKTRESKYVGEAHRMKISIARVDVNRSDVSWTIEPRSTGPVLRKGFVSVEGIGVGHGQRIVAERGDQPFVSQQDFARRVKHKTIITKLADHGALQWLPDE